MYAKSYATLHTRDLFVTSLGTLQNGKCIEGTVRLLCCKKKWFRSHSLRSMLRKSKICPTCKKGLAPVLEIFHGSSWKKMTLHKFRIIRTYGHKNSKRA